MRFSGLGRIAAIALVTWFVLPAPADAQVGSIRRGVRMIQQAEKKDTPSEAFVITPERLDAVLAVMLPRVEEAAKRQVAHSAEDEFKNWQNTFTKCVEAATQAGISPTQQSSEAAAKFSEQNVAILERMSAAAHDKKRLAYLSDTSSVLMMEYNLAIFNITKCGKPRYTPPAVIEARFAEAQRGTSEETESRTTVKERAGMTHHQFGMVRERIALWGMLQKGLISANKVDKNGVFTAAETKALQQRQADIEKLAPLFHDNSLPWTHWNDIASW